MSMSVSPLRVTATTIRRGPSQITTPHVHTLYFCGPKHPAPHKNFAQHYLCSPSSERGPYTIGETIRNTSTSSSSNTPSSKIGWTSKIQKDLEAYDKLLCSTSKMQRELMEDAKRLAAKREERELLGLDKIRVVIPLAARERKIRKGTVRERLVRRLDGKGVEEGVAAVRLMDGDWII
jgi:hypothetical protein